MDAASYDFYGRGLPVLGPLVNFVIHHVNNASSSNRSKNRNRVYKKPTADKTLRLYIIGVCLSTVIDCGIPAIRRT